MRSELKDKGASNVRSRLAFRSQPGSAERSMLGRNDVQDISLEREYRCPEPLCSIFFGQQQRVATVSPPSELRIPGANGSCLSDPLVPTAVARALPSGDYLLWSFDRPER
jgi:hypothetical protein